MPVVDDVVLWHLPPPASLHKRRACELMENNVCRAVLLHCLGFGFLSFHVLGIKDTMRESMLMYAHCTYAGHKNQNLKLNS